MAKSSKDQTVINIRPLPSSYENLMAAKRSMSPNFSIFRTPKILYRHNEQAYKPNAFSIGPFHYGDKRLEPTQTIKLNYLQGLLCRSESSEKLYRQLVEDIKSVQRDARECYAGSIETCDDEGFVQLLILDGCFIIELFRKDAEQVPQDPNDPIFTMSCLQEFLKHDLILLENQIPWLVLERLFSLTKVSETKSLIQLALDFFGNMFSSARPSIKLDLFQKPEVKIKHILDLLRYSLTLPLEAGPCVNPSDNQQISGWEPLPCATKIHEAGIKFVAVSAQSILDVKFKNGALEIPTLLIQETTESILRNLISFEQCCPNYEPIVTSYAKLIDNLIDTSKDIEILSDNNILDNWLNPEDATGFFNKLYHDTFVKKFYYYEVCKNVKNYRDRRWPRWRAFYIHNYFATPWAIVSQVVGTIILVLTFLQTLYSILGAVGDKSC